MAIRKLSAALRALVITVALGGALTAAGCGSDDDNNDSASGGDSQAAGVQKAKQEVEPLLAQPTTVGDVTKLPDPGADTKLVYLKCGVPICEGYASGAQAAAKHLGIEMKVLNAGNSPQDQAKAWDQAITESPDGVIEQGFALPLFEKQLAELKSKDIPVVTAGDTVGGTGDGAVVADVQPQESFRQIGRREANYIIANSDGKANILYVQAPEVPLLDAIKDGFESALKANCPDCKMAAENVQLKDIGRAVPSQIVSYLQKNPDVDWINFGFGDALAGVPEAVKGAGLEDVKMTSGAGSKINWNYIKNGQGQVMDLATDTPLIGWWMVDRAVRATADEKIEKTPEIPAQYLTKDTIDFDLNKGWVAVDDYQQQFAEKWGR